MPALDLPAPLRGQTRKELPKIVVAGQRCACPGCRASYRGFLPAGWSYLLICREKPTQ